MFLLKMIEILSQMIGVSPSGKASAFGADIRWFESSHPSQIAYKTLFLQGLFLLDFAIFLVMRTVPQLCTTRG